MFTAKKTQLFETQTSGGNVAVANNQFLNGAAKQSARTTSGNGALKYSTTGNAGVDQFTNLGNYRQPRSYEDIRRDCDLLWAENPVNALKFMVYARMISRKTQVGLLGFQTEKAQVGAELKHEGIMRLIWLHNKSPETFWQNIGLFVAAGSCKDILVMLRYDLMYHGWEGRVLDWNRFGNLILTLLENKSTSELMKKYLPQIKPNNKCKTLEAQANNIIAKWICSLLFGGKTGSVTYKQYRQLKTSGTAHQWQQLISRREFDKIDFNAIHGRALNLLVKGKFLDKQGLKERYLAWATKEKTIKYTGYVHELLCELDSNRDKTFEVTVEKQFRELVNKVKNDEESTQTSFIVVRDTSASMGSAASGTKFSCFNIAKALALYFSEFLTGTFAGHWIEFNSTARLHQWVGTDVVSKWRNDRSSFIGSTDFQSVIDLFCQMLKNGVPEKDFPQGILCVSDGEFNRTGIKNETNFQTAFRKLRNAGFSNEFVNSFKIVLWDLQNSYYGANSEKANFETFGNVKNCFYMSGYSAAAVKFILNNKVETAEDLLNTALDQELLNLLQV